MGSGGGTGVHLSRSFLKSLAKAGLTPNLEGSVSVRHVTVVPSLAVTYAAASTARVAVVFWQPGTKALTRNPRVLRGPKVRPVQ